MIHKFRMVFMTRKRFRIKNTKLVIHDHTTISATSSSAV